jgi:hypothetical protein
MPAMGSCEMIFFVAKIDPIEDVTWAADGVPEVQMARLARPDLTCAAPSVAIGHQTRSNLLSSN